MKIIILNLDIDASLRNFHLEQAEVIYYLCISEEDVNQLSKPIEIGMNDFQHEYNFIHSGRYRSKTVNITFNEKVPIQINNDSDRISRRTENTIPDKNEFSSFSTAASYLKLPEQNEEFINTLFIDSDFLLALRKSKFSEGRFRIFYHLYTRLISFYQNYKRKNFKQPSYKNHSNYEVYSKYLIHRANNRITSKLNRILKTNQKADGSTSLSSHPIRYADGKIYFTDELPYQNEEIVTFQNQDDTSEMPSIDLVNENSNFLRPNVTFS